MDERYERCANSWSNRDAYLSLLMDSLLNLHYATADGHHKRITGRNTGSQCYSMIGRDRMRNIQKCVETILKDEVEGDFIECGVWRGGACIFMKAVIRAFPAGFRRVWLADSFQGCPESTLHQDAELDLRGQWAATKSEVLENFNRYSLMDDIHFLEGWFKDTLPTAPISKLALLRIDADLFESTTDALTHLYPKLQPGGYCIIDDYGAYKECKKAVDLYRDANNVQEPIKMIDFTGAYWRKT